MRLLVEPFAARRAALAITDEAIAALEAVDRKMHEKGHEDARLAYGEFARNDGTFHDMIALASGNALVHETLARLHVHVHLFRLHFHARVTSDANEEHARILAAIRGRDPEGAEQVMRDHIERASASW